MRHLLRVLALAAILALSLFAVACGDDDDEGGDSAAPTAQGSTPTEGKQGGRLTMLLSSDVDYLDPGKTYYTVGFNMLYPTHRPLYSYKPGQNEPEPDLAEGPAQVSEDSKTITVKIRSGVKFAPPVNREVTSADVKYALERGFTKQVANQYTTYFADIVGAPEKPADYKEIPGIETPDDNTLIIKLDKPSGVGVAAALAMPISAPVPKEFAREFDSKNPSTYNTHVVASGPYMVKNNDEGELTGYKPGKSIEMVRNPNWDRKTDYKPAYLDSIFVRTNASNAEVASRQVLEGESMVTGENPPASELKRAVQNYEGQYIQLPAGGFRYFPLNTTIKPFDDVNVRKAIYAGFDRDAARLARGGRFVGDLPTHILPPGIPGFEEAGGAEGFTDLDYTQAPEGDQALSEKYFKEAGYESGKYDGNEEFTLVTANTGPNKAQAEVAQAQFEKMGFNVKLQTVPQDAVYTEYCQVPKKELFSCGGAGWFKDFNDPQSMLEPTFKGSAIHLEGGNNNLAQLDVPEIDSAMDEAATLQGEERFKAWADIDRLIMEQAAVIPFVWDKTTVLQSENVNGVGNGYYTSWDFAWTSLK
jgi:peptide/nickel transport system substrate-binding protein